MRNLRARAAVLLIALCTTGAPAQSRSPSLDTIEQRVKPCAACHGDQGRATREGYYPRIAGKPAGYLYNQLLNFRDGRRLHAVMTYMVDRQSDAYLREIAEHFARLDIPYPLPTPVAIAEVLRERGRRLVMDGDAARELPACRACHGTRLTGVAPAVPGLLGLPRDYVVAQFGAWQIGTRRAAAPDCMATITRRLTLDDINAIAAWIEAQPVGPEPQPETAPPGPWPLECGSVRRTRR